jgi:predicted Zn finger-like uncharacterized protein
VYTQCSKCETVFKLSAEVLRAAGGQVRCGKCGELFSALARLAEDSSAFAAGESPLELETRADSILESAESLQVVRAVAKDQEMSAPPGVEIAELEFIDSDRSMEFTLPPGELDRIFIESKKKPLPPLPGPLAEREPEPEAQPEVELKRDVEPEREAEPEGEIAPAREAGAREESGATVGHRIGLEVPEDVRREMLAGIEDEYLDPASAVLSMGRSRVPRNVLLAWLGAAVVSALLLLAQIVHQNRDWFVANAHGPLGSAVRALYGAMGAPLPQPASLSAYELRQWGVTGDPDANGTLRVRASILNTAAQLQPFPLLRVTLADRFGKKIGARDFEPSEYLGKPTARLLAPGERVDATLAILDPGKNAEGFEIDVCLRAADRRVACANDVAPQSKQ